MMQSDTAKMVGTKRGLCAIPQDSASSPNDLGTGTVPNPSPWRLGSGLCRAAVVVAGCAWLVEPGHCLGVSRRCGGDEPRVLTMWDLDQTFLPHQSALTAETVTEPEQLELGRSIMGLLVQCSRQGGGHVIVTNASLLWVDLSRSLTLEPVRHEFEDLYETNSISDFRDGGEECHWKVHSTLSTGYEADLLGEEPGQMRMKERQLQERSVHKLVNDYFEQLDDRAKSCADRIGSIGEKVVSTRDHTLRMITRQLASFPGQPNHFAAVESGQTLDPKLRLIGRKDANGNGHASSEEALKRAVSEAVNFSVNELRGLWQKVITMLNILLVRPEYRKVRAFGDKLEDAWAIHIAADLANRLRCGDGDDLRVTVEAFRNPAFLTMQQVKTGHGMMSKLIDSLESKSFLTVNFTTSGQSLVCDPNWLKVFLFLAAKLTRSSALKYFAQFELRTDVFGIVFQEGKTHCQESWVGCADIPTCTSFPPTRSTFRLLCCAGGRGEEMITYFSKHALASARRLRKGELGESRRGSAAVGGRGESEGREGERRGRAGLWEVVQEESRVSGDEWQRG